VSLLTWVKLTLEVRENVYHMHCVICLKIESKEKLFIPQLDNLLMHILYPIYNYKHGVCVSVCPSFTYLLLISFSLTSFRFHYFSGVIPLAPVPCGVFWGGGRRESPVKHGARGGASRGGPARAKGWGTGGEGPGGAGQGRGGEARQGRARGGEARQGRAG
jgi:hypothetical protein